MTLTLRAVRPDPPVQGGRELDLDERPGSSPAGRRARTFVARPASDFISFEPMTAGDRPFRNERTLGSKGPAEADRILLAGHRWRAN